MGRREEENGSVVIPRDQWVTFRKDILRKWNSWQLERFAAAKEAHSLARAATKGMRGGDKRRDAARTAYTRWSGSQAESLGSVFQHVFTWDADAGNYDLANKAPMKKDMLIHPLSRGVQLVYGDQVVLTLNDDDRRVTYSVDMSKNAVEDARKHPVTKQLLRSLKSVTWKRGTGGVFTGNDEYNQDDHEAGGGANYVTQRYGPLGKAEELY